MALNQRLNNAYHHDFFFFLSLSFIHTKQPHREGHKEGTKNTRQSTD